MTMNHLRMVGVDTGYNWSFDGQNGLVRCREMIGAAQKDLNEIVRGPLVML